MIRLLSTLNGARRASFPGDPILMLVDGPRDAFIVGLPDSASIVAVAPDNGKGGIVKIRDLVAGDLVSSPPVEAGDDTRQGVTEASHSVLDAVDRNRPLHVDWVTLLRRADGYANRARFSDLTARRTNAIMAAALLILAIEQIDREPAS